MYGPDHIFGYNTRGTRESIDKITIDDLKEYYINNFSPSLTRIIVAGNVTQDQVVSALKPLADQWSAKDVTVNYYPQPKAPMW